MSKIIASTFMSLDGYMSGPNDDMGWSVDEFDQELGRDIVSLYSSAGAIILGRKTYDIWVEYWPNAIPDADYNHVRPSEGREDPVITERINNLPKYIFSRTLAEAEWGKYNNAYVIHEITPEEINKIKQRSGKDVLLAGSASIFQTFTNLGLIEEYNVIIHPIMLGNGKPLFANISSRQRLRLVGSKTYKNNVLSLNYTV